MEKRDGETTSYGGGEDRGGGGKLRKPSARKPPATPYARPAANQAEREQRRWLSKLVDPACRLISGGASLFFPSFFSKSPAAIADSEDHDNGETETETELEQDANGGDENCTINHEMSRTTGLVGRSRAADVSGSISDLVCQNQDKKTDLPDENGLSEIEKLLKGKQFSRDQVNRLMEIINLRAAELPNLELEKKNQRIAAGGETKRPATSHETMKTPTDRNQRDLHGSLWKTSTPLPNSFIPDEVGASPIEIAKAYMGSRTLETGTSSKGMIPKDEKSLFHGAESKPFIPSPSPKPPIGWPGAMVQDQRDYLTPQIQRGRVGLHNFPRTPYSRTIFSKSKSKLSQLQGDNDKWQKLSSSLQKAHTLSGQLKSRSDALEENYGSVGPIRRSRHKLAAQSPFKGSSYLDSSSVGPSKVDNSNIFQGFLPSVKKNFESGGTSSSSQFESVDRKSQGSEAGVPTVPSKSSQIARTILEHIDRHPPTPKDKSEELELAIAGKKPVSSSITSVDPSEQDSLLHLKGFDSRKILNLDGQKKPAQENADKGNSLFTFPRQENTVKAVDSASNPLRSNVFFGNGGGVSQIKSSREVTKIAPSQVLNLQKRSTTSVTKPLLSSIYIDKPESHWTFPSDHVSGFTFPVSTASGVLSEPPTPSIMPSFLTSNPQQAKDGSDVPSYTFGSSSKSRPALLFSFPSTSSSAIQNDTSDIKFSFGSDKPRLSFDSIGKDAICY